MAKERRLPMEAQRERLLRLLTLQQIEAPSTELRMSYWRLEKALTKRVGSEPVNVILEWLEAELATLKQTGADASEAEATLLGHATEFCGALKS